MSRSVRFKRAALRASVVLMIAVLCINMVREQANASSVPEKLPNTAIYDKILTDRHFVIDTFTGNEFPENNPHAVARGMGNEDYMYVDIMDDYNTTYSEDPTVDLMKAGVDIYYRTEHMGEAVIEIPSALLDEFTTEESWTNFVSGAKNKSYESVINAIFITDYTSPSGISMASDMGDMQDLRTRYEYSSNIKKMLEYGSDFVDVLGNINTKYKKTMVNEVMPKYSDDMYNYIAEIDKVLDSAHANSKKEAFDDLFEAKYYSMFTSEDAADREWVATMHEEETLKNAGKILEYLELGNSLLGGTMEKALMLESLLQQRETMYGTLERTKEEAIKQGDDGFRRVADSYLALLQDDNLSDADKQALKAMLLALSDEVQSKVDSLAWKAVEKGIKKTITSVLCCSGLPKEATTIFVGEKLAKFSDVITFITSVGDLATGFGNVCERIYEIKYLQQMKEYVKKVYEEDERIYLNAKKNGASADRLDELAKIALDDLYLLKQLTLRANDLGYSICEGQADSWTGKIRSWISNCNDAQDIENRYKAMQSVLVDTMIDPIPQVPIIVNEDQTLKIIKNEQEDLRLVLESPEANDFVFGEPEYRLLGGIDIRGGTVVFNNRSDEEVYISSINSTTGSGTITIPTACKLVTSSLGVNESASLFICPEAALELDVTRIENEGTLSIQKTTINADNISSSIGMLSFYENCTVQIQQNMELSDTGGIGVNNSTVTVEGNISAIGCPYTHSGLKIEDGAYVLVNGDVTIQTNGGKYTGYNNSQNINHYCSFLGGTLEIKGDLRDITDYENPDNTSYAWESREGFNLKLTGDRMQVVKVQKDGWWSIYGTVFYDGLGNLEVTSPGIIAEGKIQIYNLMTDLLIDSDVEYLHIQNTVEGKKIEIKGNATIGTNDHMSGLNLDKGSKLTVSKDLRVEGSMYVNDGSDLIVNGEYVQDLESNSYVSSAVVSIANGSHGEFRKNISINNLAGFYVTNSTVTVAGNISASGCAYTYSGLKTDEGAYVLANGDVIIQTNGGRYTGYNNSQNIQHYCSFSGGTLEIKGDLKDITDYENPDNTSYAWESGEGFNLKLTGDRMQVVQVQKNGWWYLYSRIAFDGLGKLEVTSPGIIAEGHIQMNELLTDLVISGNVEGFNIEEPVKGKTIEISGSATVGAADDMGNCGLALDEKSKLTVGNDLRVAGNMGVYGESELIVEGECVQDLESFTYVSSATMNIYDGSRAEFLKNVSINNFAGFNVSNATVTVAGNISANGCAYPYSGLKIEEGANVLVNGDVTIRANGGRYTGYNNSQNISYYCSFSGGTLEVKGDLKDLTDYENPDNTISAWNGGGDSFHLKLTGDSIQTVRARDSLGILEMTSPGTIMEGNLICYELLSNLNVYSCPDNISINKWDEHYVKLIGIDKFPSITLPYEYGMKVSADGDLYNVIYAPATGDTFTVNYIIENETVKTVNNYAAGSLAIPYELLAETNKSYKWFADPENTATWDFKTDTVTKNTDLYGVDGGTYIQALRKELTQLLETAHAVDQKQYTEESVAAFAQAVAEAEAVLANEQAAEEELTAAIDSLQAAIDSLEKVACTHQMKWTSEAAATCENDGNIEYWTCELCGVIFSNAEGTEEITQANTVIPALGHDFGEWETVEPECTDANPYQMHTCSVCGFFETEGDIETGHEWEDHYNVDVKPTCTTEGSESIHCSKCDTAHESRTIPALGHNWSGWTVTVEATCTEDGIKENVCSVCGDKLTEVIPAIGHSWGSTPTVEKATTCTEDGMEATHCTKCNAVMDGSEKVIPSKGHQFSAWTTTKEATETADGQQSHKCSVCGKTENRTIAQLAPTLPAVKITKPKAEKKSATIKWKKISTANQKKIAKIQIQYSTDKTFKTGVKTINVKKSATSKKITKLKSKKTYYVRIRAYKRSGGVEHVSKWSTVKPVKAK